MKKNKPNPDEVKLEFDPIIEILDDTVCSAGSTFSGCNCWWDQNRCNPDP